MGPSTRVLGYIKQARFPFSSLSIGVKVEKERGKEKEKKRRKSLGTAIGGKKRRCGAHVRVTHRFWSWLHYLAARIRFGISIILL